MKTLPDHLGHDEDHEDPNEDIDLFCLYTLDNAGIASA